MLKRDAIRLKCSFAGTSEFSQTSCADGDDPPLLWRAVRFCGQRQVDQRLLLQFVGFGGAGGGAGGGGSLDAEHLPVAGDARRRRGMTKENAPMLAGSSWTQTISRASGCASIAALSSASGQG